MQAPTINRTWRDLLLARLAVAVTDRGWPCPRRLSACIVNADLANALREAEERMAADLAGYFCPN
jgi:hypothetical protein